MACSMCESHINEAVPKAFDVKKGERIPQQKIRPSSSTEQEIDEQALRQVIDATVAIGYRPSGASPIRRRLFSFGR